MAIMRVFLGINPAEMRRAAVQPMPAPKTIGAPAPESFAQTTPDPINP
jgi:hypothetical protein